ncbi:hypothetical protein PC118_g5961 [Phytophthora cactorum]|uniref:Elicitin n=1 Tax=Phytophthora cactorum TaxID=29920 RepID=A0A8T1GFS8_9STRA|nr:hypothetical protein PC111_g5476 [Phytophthora cactorum]KAG2989782.1 hypothetical protein PC118_g5961 [Phytophthora cactorum]KAG3029595.1 hypothetical protein PC119_g6538 [Phytophthora cactorum]KAG3075857.1 hypothetical protein PC121_g7909 [Phytophthora cactorum]KAG3093970.1 hypothetical protein PC122_g5942 [Phytophthora cactorum]
MCASDECRALIEDVLALKPVDCYLSFAGVKLNAHKMTCRFKDVCKANMDSVHWTQITKMTTPNPTADEKY